MAAHSDLRKKMFHIYEKYMLAMGILGQFLFYVQAFKIFTTRSASDLSIAGFSLGLISVTSWLIYGLLLKNKVLAISNAVAVVGALLVVIGILIHG